jgi:hypothetical protein
MVRQDLSAPELRVFRIAPGWERRGLPQWWFTEQGEAAAGESASFREGEGMRDASMRPGMTVTIPSTTLAGQVLAKIDRGTPRSCAATSCRNHGKSGTQDGVKEKMAITPGVFDVICSIREHPDRTCSKSGRRLQAIRAGRAGFLPRRNRPLPRRCPDIPGAFRGEASVCPSRLALRPGPVSPPASFSRHQPVFGA